MMDYRIEHMVDEINGDRQRVRDLIVKYENLQDEHRMTAKALEECQEELGILNK